jgi:hypothetical protein
MSGSEFIEDAAENPAGDHVWAFDRLATYVASGMSTAERLRIQRHLASCDECRRTVDGLETLDAKMRRLFAGLQAPATLEDRTVQALRTTPSTPAKRNRAAWNRPMKAMMVAAGLMLLVGVGWLLSENRPNRRNPNVVMLFDSSRSMGEKGNFLTSDADPAGVEFDADINYKLDRKAGVSVPGPVDLNDPIGFLDGEGGSPPVNLPGPGGLGNKGMGGAVEGVKESLGEVGGYDFRKPQAGTFNGRSGAPRESGGGGERGAEEKREKALEEGGGTSARRSFFATPTTPQSRESRSGGKSVTSRTEPAESKPVELGDKAYFLPGESARPSESKLSDDSPGKDSSEKREGRDGLFDKERKSLQKDGVQELERRIGDLDNHDKKLGDRTLGLAPGGDPIPKKKSVVEVVEGEFQGPAKTPLAVDPPESRPAATMLRKIIIRSGDIEFEVDSFDASVAAIVRLIGKTKDAFVATVNSEKLANGKMRGNVVVRMPPERLDDFVLELRQSLGKTGELKGQRIGSEDVTKRYTDLESELKAHRTMVERLLSIIKDGKGQVKDLLAVEKDLGVYREKIEKIEGELRYYSNLASLSTLSITLQEKEIRAAAAYTETEQVKTGIEVEDVEKAYQEAQAAIRELKGRILRADMKQQAAGQFNANLVFEIAPEQSGPMRDRLRQLGNMVRLDVERVQRIDNGGEPTKVGNPDGKIRRGDTEFQVALYNLANVEPRETSMLTLIAGDVPTVYRKLRETLAKLKVQIRNANLLENDKVDVSGQLDFNARRADEPAVQQALEAAGEIVKRKVDRRADAANVTDAKVGFAVRIVSTATIEPRETIRRLIAVPDVADAFRRLQEAIGAREIHGHVRSASLDEARRQDVSATLDFDLPRSEEPALRKLLDELGESLGRKSERKVGDNVTDAKVLYSVGIIAETSVEARDYVKTTLAAVDVPEAYRKLHALVQGLKGQIRGASVQEADRRNITAHLDVVVARGDEPAVQSALADLGEVLSRSNERRSEGERVTTTKTAFTIDLVSASTIEPRKTYVIDEEVEKVKERVAEFDQIVQRSGGRIIEGPLVGTQKNGKLGGHVVYAVPLASAEGIVLQIQQVGSGHRPPEQKVTEDIKAPEGRLAIARIEVRLHTADQLVPNDEGFASQFRTGLSWSLRGLLVSVSFLVTAIVFLAPWALLVWAIVWMMRRERKEPTPEAVVVPTSNSPSP